MKLPAAILAKTLDRFDSLMEQGRQILGSAKYVPPTTRRSPFTGDIYQASRGGKKLDPESFIEWRTKVATLLALVIPKGHVHRPAAEDISILKCDYDRFKAVLSFLSAIKDDLENGFLDDMAATIEAEIASDYMGQAEHLLAEGLSGHFDHVPAAVLAGAVLEQALRALCGEQTPPILLQNSKGEPKTLNPLIDDLKKAGVFNEAKAKQLRAWAAIRNHAAHGEFDQFKRTDVESMISGINNFLSDYLK